METDFGQGLAWLSIRIAAVATALLSLGPVNAQEQGWPRAIETPKGSIVIYQPQVDTFEGNELTSRAAVSVTPTGKTEPVFGVVWVNARVDTDRDTRRVRILDIKVPTVRFPNATEEQEKDFTALLEREIPSWHMTISLDRLLAMLDVADTQRMTAEGFNNTPPKIIFSTYPAILVTIDGEPQLREIEKSGLKHVVNTPFLIVAAAQSNFLYAGDERWFTSSRITGPWLVTTSVPTQVAALAPVEEEREAQEQTKKLAEELAEEDAPPPEPELTVPPGIIIATEPTELIVSDGEPEYAAIPDTELLTMSNTESDILLEIATQKHFVLLSGRWFVGESLDGPWTYVRSDELPAEFSEIPAESDVGHLRVWVAGTEEAKEAILDQQIPQTSAVKRDATIQVTYDGIPHFEQIEGTDVYHAINSSFQVLRIESKYYCAHEGVWYAADQPLGPWSVADSVPREEIDSIPPESSAYNTKYVYIYDSTPSVVYVGYYPGYSYSYVYHGSVVYGTGWYYRPWWGTYYYARPATWGFHVRWNPWYGWGYGFSYNTGRFTFGIGFGGWGGWYRGGWWGPARYRPYYRGYARGGYRGYRAGRVDSRIRNQNIYNRRSNVARNSRVGTATGTRRPTATGQRSNNVYADRNGNVHRSTPNGWQQRSGGSWSSGSGSRNLQGASNARQRGSARTQSYGRSGAGRARGGGRRR